MAWREATCAIHTWGWLSMSEDQREDWSDGMSTIIFLKKIFGVREWRRIIVIANNIRYHDFNARIARAKRFLENILIFRLENCGRSMTDSPTVSRRDDLQTLGTLTRVCNRKNNWSICKSDTPTPFENHHSRSTPCYTNDITFNVLELLEITCGRS